MQDSLSPPLTSSCEGKRGGGGDKQLEDDEKDGEDGENYIGVIF